MYFINPSQDKLKKVLESWQWIGLDGCEVLSVTAFGDIFFQSEEGIKFLDTLEGNLKIIASDEDEYQSMLDTDEGKDNFLLSGFVDRAVSEGMILESNQCYDFVIPPILGGPIEFENIQCQDFVVAINIAGQIHKKIKDLPPGTKIDKIIINGDDP
jgi:hypothetical protein